MPALMSVARTGLVAGTVLGIHAKVLYWLKSADLSYPVSTFCAQTVAAAKTKSKSADVTAAPGHILFIAHPSRRSVLDFTDSAKTLEVGYPYFHRAPSSKCGLHGLPKSARLRLIGHSARDANWERSPNELSTAVISQNQRSRGYAGLDRESGCGRELLGHQDRDRQHFQHRQHCRGRYD